MSTTPLSSGVGYDPDQIIFDKDNAYPGMRQDQAEGDEAGSDLIFESQSAGVGSDAEGGDIVHRLGAKDGIGGLAAFEVQRKLPDGTSFVAFSVTPGATTSGVTVVSAGAGAGLSIPGFVIASITLETLAVANQTGTYTISTSTVDNYGGIVANQTTSSITYQLDNPTSTGTAKMFVVMNKGSAEFTVDPLDGTGASVLVGPNTNVIFFWDGSGTWTTGQTANAAGLIGRVQLSNGAGGFSSTSDLRYDSGTTTLFVPNGTVIRPPVSTLTIGAGTALLLDAGTTLSVGKFDATLVEIGRTGCPLTMTSSTHVATSTGTSSWANTSGDLTFSTVTSGALALSSVGALNFIAGANSTWGVTGTLTKTSTGVSSWANTSGNLTLSTVTSGTLALTSAGALNFTAAANSTWAITGTLGVTSTGATSWANTGGNLTLSTVTSGTLAVTSAGALNFTAGANSTWAVTGTLSQTSTGVSSWVNTGGNFSISTATSGTMIVDSVAALQLGVTNATSIALGKTSQTNSIDGNWTLTGNSTASQNALTITGFGNTIGWGIALNPSTSADMQYVSLNNSSAGQIGFIASTGTQTGLVLQSSGVMRINGSALYSLTGGGVAIATPAASATLVSLGYDTSSGQIGPVADGGKMTVTATKTSAYTASWGESVQCDPSGGAFTVTLPAASAAVVGQSIEVVNITTSTNVITISRNAAPGTDTFTPSSTSSVAIAAAGGVMRIRCRTSSSFYVS